MFIIPTWSLVALFEQQLHQRQMLHLAMVKNNRSLEQRRWMGEMTEWSSKHWMSIPGITHKRVAIVCSWCRKSCCHCCMLNSSVGNLFAYRLRPCGRILRKWVVDKCDQATPKCGLVQLQKSCDESDALGLTSEEGGEWAVLLSHEPDNSIDVNDKIDNYPHALWFCCCCIPLSFAKGTGCFAWWCTNSVKSHFGLFARLHLWPHVSLCSLL